MAGQSLEDALGWLRIVSEHHHFGHDPGCEATDDEKAGLAGVIDIVIGHVTAAEAMRLVEREKNHAA